MAFTHVFQNFNKTWLHVGDGAADVFVGDDTVLTGPYKGTLQTKDEIRAGGGDDYLDGETGRNILYGEAGNDGFTIGDAADGTAWDRAFGGSGADVFYASAHSPIAGKLHLVNGGSGTDTFWFHLYAGVADLRGDTVFLDGRATTRLSSIETVIGSSHDDILRAGGRVFEMAGAAGDDTLIANPEAKPKGYYNGTLLIGGIGRDELRGGDHGDTLFDHSNLFDGKPDSTEAETDVLYGGGGVDRLFSYSGDDRLFGGDGGDRIFSLAGNDIIRGGKGSDHIAFGYALTWEETYARPQGSLYGLSIDGGANGRGGDTVDFSMVTLSFGALIRGVKVNLGVDKGWDLSSPDGPQKFRLKQIENIIGTARDDILIGSAKDNRLQGAGGDDLVKGGAGKDVLEGGDGSDRLFGGANADVLVSDFDGDILSGGSGIDRFEFKLSNSEVHRGIARITDYDTREAIITDWDSLLKIEMTDTTDGALVSGDGGRSSILFEGVKVAELSLDRFFVTPSPYDDDL
ncbi:calcium-binding protein [Pseudodonghicola xiamenensis]|uniref:Hemolysin-type calcium-binding repeat-containing protein n=1 Tax=Pseudodonghicola xiamenensis TaxID=337702 RepID=A0A8J3H8B5_9RHOB|nr:calcium-binding protein [Pseudodonghicola xiamenensis]GHG90418.1 hypothetical protein GCM10010961_20730 [Pseudodonghicola xiamenensis]